MCWLIQPNRCAQNQSTLLACKKQTSLSTTINNLHHLFLKIFCLRTNILTKFSALSALNQGHGDTNCFHPWVSLSAMTSHSQQAEHVQKQVVYSHFIVIICVLEQYLLFTQFKSKFEATTGSTVSFSNMNEGHYSLLLPCLQPASKCRCLIANADVAMLSWLSWCQKEVMHQVYKIHQFGIVCKVYEKKKRY